MFSQRIGETGARGGMARPPSGRNTIQQLRLAWTGSNLLPAGLADGNRLPVAGREQTLVQPNSRSRGE
ncbi:hypothetical protein ZHAS_00005184 [Anopheles sinensis]|uniref:Uncharacterized protein n=1 Tax=Anopheles sinensis TaxID=74873 RepID=A0A084VIS4_ANOSI|nr:hypothetical protein ZHAS_00005184 [Anopheles sinensis]